MRLGDIQIKGEGKVLLDVDEPQQFLGNGGCNDAKLVDSVEASNASLATRIWPVLNRGLPLLDLFERGKGEDTMAQSSNTDKVRVWNFDDSGSEEMAERCGENVVACVRQEDELTFGLPKSVDQSQSTIIIKQEDICINTDSFECHLFVEHINLESTKVLIETGTDAKTAADCGTSRTTPIQIPCNQVMAMATSPLEDQVFFVEQTMVKVHATAILSVLSSRLAKEPIAARAITLFTHWISPEKHCLMHSSCYARER